METVLNVSWLIIALTAAVGFRVWAARQPQTAAARRLRRTAGLALVCIVALLFPIISVTDDLLPNASVLEEWSAARRAAIAITIAQHTSLASTTAGLPALPPPGGRIALACIGLATLPVLTVLSPSTTTVSSFRGPPSVSL